MFCTPTVRAMTVAANANTPAGAPNGFDALGVLISSGMATARTCRSGETIFAQGEPSDHVLYVQSGTVKLSAVSKNGREAVVAMLGPGNVFGDGCLGGQKARAGSAAAVGPTEVLLIGRGEMAKLLREDQRMSEWFIARVVSRIVRIEEDLLDQLLNPAEKRLARALLCLAREGQTGVRNRSVPRLSQETLAGMIGTTRSRVNFFLNKFKRSGCIQYESERRITINESLLRVVLH
jgi:CRP/FNR family transcriptional regulator, cyclic AMP receptor protein